MILTVCPAASSLRVGDCVRVWAASVAMSGIRGEITRALPRHEPLHADRFLVRLANGRECACMADDLEVIR